jgi:hypothetical protein
MCITMELDDFEDLPSDEFDDLPPSDDPEEESSCDESIHILMEKEMQEQFMDQIAAQ